MRDVLTLRGGRRTEEGTRRMVGRVGRLVVDAEEAAALEAVLEKEVDEVEVEEVEVETAGINNVEEVVEVSAVVEELPSLRTKRGRDDDTLDEATPNIKKKGKENGGGGARKRRKNNEYVEQMDEEIIVIRSQYK